MSLEKLEMKMKNGVMEIYPELKHQRKMTCFVREMSVGVQELDVMKEKLSHLKYRRRIEPWKTRSEPEEETPAHLQGPGAEAVENNARLDGVPGSGFGPARSTGVSRWRNNAEAPYFNEVFFDFEGGKETEVTKVTNDYWIYDQVFGKMENVDEKGVGFNGRRLRMEKGRALIDMEKFVSERMKKKPAWLAACVELSIGPARKADLMLQQQPLCTRQS